MPRSGRTHRIRFTAITVSGILAAIHAPSMLAGQAGDIERVVIVLGSPVIYRALPFDEPFYLTGRSGSLIDSVAVWISATPDRDPGCSNAPLDSSVSSWQRMTGVPSDSFYIRIDELPPNRSFGLCVQTKGRQPDSHLADLRADWRTAIDSAFRAHASAGGATAATPWTPDASELREFQTVLLTRVGNNVEPRPGSLLDSSLGPDGFARGLPGIVRISSAQHERDLAIADFKGSARRVAESLGRLKTHPGLARLLAIRTAPNSGLRAFHSAHRAGLEAAAYIDLRSRGQLDAVAVGETALVSAFLSPLPQRVVLSEVWDPADLEPLGRHLAETAEQVSGLLAAIRTLGANPELRELAALSAGEIDELDADVLMGLEALAAVQNHLVAIRAELAARSSAVTRTANRLVAHEQTTTAVETHTHYDVKTTARNHVSADFGALYLWDMEEVTPVLGANFYFRPVNRDRGPGGHPLRRFSLSIGLTTSSLEREGDRADLFGSFNVAVGLGARLTRLLRVSLGGVFLNGVDPDPMIDETTVRVTPYAALTLDFVVKDLLSSLFGRLF